MDIADLNLSVRAYNAVCRAGIKTIPELYEKYQLDLAQLSREIGPNHTKEVGDALTKHREEVWEELRKEEPNMLVFTSKLPPAQAEATTPEYLAAFNLNARIHYCKDSVERGLAEMCILIGQMHSEKQYKQLGYQNFEDYCQEEFGFTREQGRKYADVGSMLEQENANSSWHFDTIGINKLHLLSKLDEPTREAVQETVDVESVTVKELKAQIAKLEADKDAKTKQFQAAMESKDAEISEVRSGWKRRSDTLIEKIGTLQQRITELEERPVEHDVVDNTEELEALRQERDAANAALTEAQKQLAERPMVQAALPGDGGERRRGEYAAISNAVANALDDLMDFLEDNDHCSEFRYFACRAKEKLREYNSKLNDMLAKEETSCQ